MRVLHFVNSYSNTIGGAERIVRRLHLGLLGAGHESRVFGLYHNTGRDDLPSAHFLPGSTPYRWSAFRAIAKVLSRESGNFDLIHVHLFPSLLYLSIYKRLGKIACPLVATEHSTSNQRRQRPGGKGIDRFTYAPYQAIAAISQGTAEALQTWQPQLAERIRVIHNGAPLAHEQPRAVHYQTGEELCLLSVGSLRSAKNYLLFLEALAAWPFQNWRYRIAGEGPLKEAIEEKARALGLEGRVELLGRREDLNQLWQQHHLFAMPSAWEGFGLAALEAMNASMPVLVSEVPGLSELVHRDGALIPGAFTFDPRRVDEMVAALERARQHLPNVRTEALFRRSLDFSEPRMLQEYLTFYRAVLAR